MRAALEAVEGALVPFAEQGDIAGARQLWDTVDGKDERALAPSWQADDASDLDGEAGDPGHLVHRRRDPLQHSPV